MFGVVGLGQMGGSIARRLLAEGRQVVVCDVRVEAVEASGAKLVAGTPAEVGAECSNSAGGIVIVVVRDDAEVRDVVCGENGILAGVSEGGLAAGGSKGKALAGTSNSSDMSEGGLAAGGSKGKALAGISNSPEVSERGPSESRKDSSTSDKPVILIHSTVQPETVEEVAQACAEEGITLLDAPVTGGAGAADNGDLVVMLGGDQQVCAEVAPKLSDYAGKVVRVGGLGAGQKAKIARNLITYSEWVIAAEATALAEAAEVDVEQLWEIIDHSDRHIGTHGGYSGVRRLLPAPEMMKPLAELARKDLSLAAELARQIDHNPWLPEQTISNIPQALQLEDAEGADGYN